MMSVAVQAADPPAVSHDGLTLTKNKNFDVVYVRDGATLAGYRQVMLDPVQVAFDKSWTRDRRQVSANDRERIRKGMAEEFRRVLTEELEERGGYEVVESADPGVLRVSAAVIDLFITAPDTMSAGRSKTFAVSAGRMTLIAELRDAESGAILARVADKKEATNHGTSQWTTRSSNVADARRILRSWAGVLRKGLDSARGS
jgi:hypothetical protein